MDSHADGGSKGSPARWEALGSTPVADCRVFRVNRVDFRHPRRTGTSDFFVIDGPDWVQVVARTADGQLVFVRQFRFGTREFSLEVPGGMIDAGEDPVAAARRELVEETGYGGGEARLLARIRPNPAIQTNTCHIVLIDGVRPIAALAWDEHEELETHLLPAAEALALARNGGITHSLSITALFFLADSAGQAGPPPAV